MEGSDKKVQLQTERIEEVLILSLSGEVHGLDVHKLHDELRDATGGPDKLVLLDLEKLLYINSAGLSSVLMVAKRLQEKEAKFAVCSLSRAVKGVFKMSAFDKVIDVFESRSEAIEAIRSG
ncbi:MAG: STAS domain-containing protein [Candidatus Dadabacteria bacterium]|nr:STAS domain-containing protein [Candidatus Dadabacteria bacterium]MDE0520090.1 STAS domain-containing protein [Candidatus Dadabacteria bacterium]MDE0662752.1 STAS domain-containing protein [Candidatus Dadabacteria bacterium]